MTARSHDDRTTPFDVLADPIRRYLLATLLEDVDSTVDPAAADPVPIDGLATDVASLVHDHPIVTDDQVTEVQIELAHSHLPRLESAGIVTREERAGSSYVSPADHPMLEREWVRDLLADPTGGAIDDEAVFERTLEAFQVARRHTICTVLARQRGHVPVIDLAAMVVTAEADEERRLTDVSASTAREVAIELVHSHLPALEGAGLTAFDRENRTAAIEPDAPQWRADWLAASPLSDVVDRLEPTRRPGSTGVDAEVPEETDRTVGCWTIDGAERVIARSHEIADLAEDELFVTVPDDGMVQQRCLERWHAAAERGVDVYVGSRCPTVRERVREAIPDATICEPQFDWLNLPVDQLDHGRVVFSDRSHVMLVAIDENTPREVPNVTAITGVGSHNVLVSLVREHVGPRLDRLEDERDDGGRTNGSTPLPM